MLDPDDIKAIVDDLHGDIQLPKDFAARRISLAKNNLVSAEKYLENTRDYPEIHDVNTIYNRYERELRRLRKIDIDDVLVYSYNLLLKYPAVRAKYHQRYKYLLVDEMQDVNKANMSFLRLLTNPETKNIMGVADDDQAIYGFRGAQSQYVVNFDKFFPTVKVITLEENYRSTKTVVNAAVSVINHNVNRKRKDVQTANPAGTPVTVYIAKHPNEEAAFVSHQIQRALDKGISLNEIAVLLRSHYISPPLVKELLKAGVPHTVVRRISFFDQKVVKDVLAYLRLAIDPTDEHYLRRIVNTPTRKIGPRTLAKVEAVVHSNQCSLWEGFRLYGEQQGPPAQEFVSTIEKIHEVGNSDLPLYDKALKILELSKLVTDFSPGSSDDEEPPEEAYHTLIDIIEDFSRDEGASLETLLESFVLQTEARQAGDAVKIMTIHSAKGLEFEKVFVMGLEEGVFPHTRNIQEGGLEEERRLAYVAFTRAKKELVLTCSAGRGFGEGKAKTFKLSRFIQEIPSSHLRKHPRIY